MKLLFIFRIYIIFLQIKIIISFTIIKNMIIQYIQSSSKSFSLKSTLVKPLITSLSVFDSWVYKTSNVDFSDDSFFSSNLLVFYSSICNSTSPIDFVRMSFSLILKLFISPFNLLISVLLLQIISVNFLILLSFLLIFIFNSFISLTYPAFLFISVVNTDWVYESWFETLGTKWVSLLI